MTTITPLAPRPRRSARGQGMTEYIIIVALIAISAIGVISLYGDNIKGLFAMAAIALAGETSSPNLTETTPASTLKKGAGLRGFAQNNGR